MKIESGKKIMPQEIFKGQKSRNPSVFFAGV